MITEFGLQRLGGFPSVVVGNFGAQVVGDMSLRETVSKETVNISVHGRKSASLKIESSLAIMRQPWIGVLQESNQDDPVMNYKIGYDVILEDGQKVGFLSEIGQATDCDCNTQVRPEYLGSMTFIKHDSVGVEVVCPPRGIMFLARSIDQKVSGKAHRLMDDQLAQSPQRGILQQVIHLLVEASRLRSLDILLAGVLGQWGQTELRASVRYEGLVALHVTGGRMMLGVGDSPGVEGHQEGRVQDPADEIVDRFGG